MTELIMNDGLINPQTKQNDREIVHKGTDHEIVQRPKKDSEIFPHPKPPKSQKNRRLDD